MTERTDACGQVHAMLSASGASRWLKCTPSPRMEELCPPQPQSSYAAEGVRAHTVAAACARKLLKLPTPAGEPFEADLVDADLEQMLEHGRNYAKLIKSRARNATEIGLEARVDFSEWAPSGFGTCDCYIVKRNQLEVIDYKYGRGVPVSAVGNSQMRLYALGLLARYPRATRIRTMIVQPRICEEPSVEEISAKELLAWAELWVRPQAELAYRGEGDFSPSHETCRWCGAKDRCWARKAMNIALLDTELVTVADAAMALKFARDRKSWEEDLKALVTNALLAGEEVLGWKLVEGRKEGSLLLVPESDRRPAHKTEGTVLAAFNEDEGAN